MTINDPLTALAALPADAEDLDIEEEEEGEDSTSEVSEHVDEGPALVKKGIIPAGLLKKYVFYSYRHAGELLKYAYPDEFKELIEMLTKFEITVDDIKRGGGNQSRIPKKVSALMPADWKEMRVQADLTVRVMTRSDAGKRKKNEKLAMSETILKNHMDGHLIDYVKGRVAFDLEWNSKDQTFDRDLFAMSAAAATNVVAVGVLLTRSAELTPEFIRLGNGTNGKPLKEKYGASTTWMDKLLYRLEANRHGYCPILAIGILPACITDLDTYLAANPPAPAPAKNLPAAAAAAAEPAPAKKAKKGNPVD